MSYDSYDSAVWPENRSILCECECDCSASETSRHPVRYVNGEVQYAVQDIDVPGFGMPWGHGRYWSNQLLGYENNLSTRELHDVGSGWLVREWPYLVEHSPAVTGVERSFQIVRGHGDTLIFDASDDETSFFPRYGSKATLAHDKLVNLEFILTDEHGYAYRFHDGTTATPGVLKSIKIPGGVEITPSEDAQGRYLTRTMGETVIDQLWYQYELGHISAVVYQRGAGSTAVPVRNVSYEYIFVANEPWLLKTATLGVWNAATAEFDSVGTYYYRYYGSQEVDGFYRALKYVFGPEAFRRLSAATSPNSPFDAQDSVAEDYADFHFKYDEESRHVVEETAGGHSQTEESLPVTFEYGYETNPVEDPEDPGYPGFTNYDRTYRRTIETQPDGSEIKTFTNRLGQVILRSHEREGDILHIEYQEFGGEGQASEGKVTLRASNAAVVSYYYNEESGVLDVTLHDSAGLVRTFTYYTANEGIGENTPGKALGYLEYEKIRNGNNGQDVAVRKLEYYQHVGDGAIVYPIARETVYVEDGGSGLREIKTTYEYDWHSHCRIK